MPTNAQGKLLVHHPSKRVRNRCKVASVLSPERTTLANEEEASVSELLLELSFTKSRNKSY
jgi:hypothetical protein